MMLGVLERVGMCSSGDSRSILTAATGALLLLMSDIATQAVLESLPVGVATSAVGGAYLMVVLTVAARSRKVLR